MPLQLAPMQESDIPSFAAVDAAAMGNWAYALAVFPPGANRQQMAEQFTRASWGQNPDEHWLKVVDTDAGDELVAAACWRFVLDAAAVEKKFREREEQATAARKEVEGGAAPSLWNESKALGLEFDREFLGRVPHAVLSLLVTHPRHQRRGAGGMLVKWGCDKADEYGIPCVLTASEAGLVGYLKQGFEVKKISELDLRPYGYDVTELRRHMIRPAKAKAIS